MLESLKQEVCEANLELVKLGLVLFTWGNVSALAPSGDRMVIKPSGVSYDGMKAEDMVVVSLDGEIVEGNYKPSSDTATHVELYKQFDGVGAIVHTHSKWATIWAQARKAIPALGTTHADSFYGGIPITRKLTAEEIERAYEQETGKVIIETFQQNHLSPLDIPAVIVANHGPFAWGKTASKAVENAAVMEYVAEMAYFSLSINPQTEMDQVLLDKHFLRKHGKNAYYGQA
ncbi:MAG: L-ribulose-5-phosphate 4-epimerase [Anaerolineaceae bacterium]|nr:L-ribulose-5-phosphate 4-epimerase [Anaerolineaceae bacterium]